MTTTHPDTRHVDVAALRDATAAAAEILTARPRRAAAVSYLRQRGIDARALPERWSLGYAPPGWTRLVDTLRGRFPDRVLLDAGLAQRSSRGTLIDTFRDRIMFPIHDTRGHVAGFIGRDLSGAPAAPKYLNTRHSALFEKGSLLYGLNEARTLNPDPGQPVVVEGPLDVLAIAARNTDLQPVAACGTAFTSTHARLVAGGAAERRVVVAMDGDTAGRSAATTAGEILRRAGLDVRIAILPNGVDPADHLAHGGRLDTIRHINALPLLAVYVERAIAAQGDHMQWVEGRLLAARAIASYLSTYPVSHAAAQIGWISQALDIDPATFTFELAAAYRTATPVALDYARGVERVPSR